jgi:hypothetical protein
MTATRRPARAGILLLLAFSFALLTSAVPPAWADATPNDVARFLAGLEPAADSPLAPLTRDPQWQSHARSLEAAWTRLDRDRLSKIRTWSAAHLTEPKPAVLYMFSGPDFLYVDAFFPDRPAYVLSGLEPVGEVPTITPGLRRSLGSALAGLRYSVGSAFNYSFFITHQMKTSLRATRLNGVLPVLYLFLARSGKTVHEVTLIGIDTEGAVVAAGTSDAVPGVKIVFSGPGGKKQTLYYVQTDVSDHGLKRTGFLRFCEKLGVAEAFLKSASYLLHSDSFARLRGFLLDRSVALVQDDSGIPVRFFKSDEWRLRPFGRYLGPIAVFPGRHQRGLSEIYRRSNPPRLDFGVGYRWRPHESNLLLAQKGAKEEGVAQETTGRR